MQGFENKNYVVEKVLRKRPLGNVFKARRVSDGVLCAIKELDVSHMSEEERDDAMEEIRVLSTVRNENVISYHDAFASENKLYVVMEYCDEPDLGRHIKTRAENQKFFSEAQVWSYLIQMLRGLVAVHSRGLIHRDVRSGNIIQLDSSAIKIGDIRVGKVLKEGPAVTTDIGNPLIVPPEVWQNKAYTFKSDVWAVGCVLYEMITLAVPFGGCSLPDLRAKVIEGKYNPIPKSFSTGLSTVLKLLLNPNQATRVSARDMLLHPIIQAHFHHAPAPAPILRVRASQGKSTFGSIAAQSSSSVELKSSYPTLVVPVDKQQLHGKALDSNKDVPVAPENGRHKSALSSERPTAPAVRSRVAPVLAPRAVLSSRDNDEMLADANRPLNQASKVKVPRVAMLSKAVPKSPPTETFVSPSPQSLASTPRVNMRHFKTAYIQSPKVDPNEFQTASFPDDRSDVSRRERLEPLVNGALKSKSVATPPTPKIVTPRREKSTESVRSAGSSRSDDSSIRVRALIDTLDPSPTESVTPRKENSVESVGSMGSSSHSTGESVMRVRAPVDFSDAPQAGVMPYRGDSFRSVVSAASSHSNGSVRAPVDISDAPQAGVLSYRGDSFRSVTSAASSHSNGSGVSVRAALTDLDAAGPPPPPISDDLQTSLAGDGAVPPQAPPESVTHVDAPEPSERPNELAENDPFPPDSPTLNPRATTTTTTKPSNGQTKATTPIRSAPKTAVDGGARKTRATNGNGVHGLAEVPDRRLPTSRNRRLSFGGTGSERPLWTDDHTKIDPPARESSSGTRKPAAGNGVSTKGQSDSVGPARNQAGGATDPSRVVRPSTGTSRPSSDGSKRSSQKGEASGVLPRKPLTARAKDEKGATGNSANPSKSVAPIGRKGSGTPPPVPPTNSAKRQGASRVNGGSATGAAPSQSPQGPLRSRRLSLDFPLKGREVQPMGRGLGHISGTAS